jgi:ATP-dependent Clp protease ATP-binding subunit ClpC
MGRIVDIMFRDIAKRSLEQLELTVELADEARQILIDRGYDPKYGARPLRRILQTMVEDRLAEAVLDRTVLPGDAVLITADPEKEGGLRMTPVRRKRRKAPAKPGGTGKGAKLVSA